MKHQLLFSYLMALQLIGLVPLDCYAENADDFNLWRETVLLANNERLQADSIQFEFNYENEVFLPSGEKSVTRNTQHYVRSGELFYSHSDLAQGTLGESEGFDQLPSFTAEMAFDGEFGRQRAPGSEGVLFMVRGEKSLKLPTPLPHTLVEQVSADSILRAVERGRLTLVSFDLAEDRESGPKYVAQFDYKDAQRPALRITYDPAKGYLPVQLIQYDEAGNITSRVYDVVLSTVSHEGNSYFVYESAAWERLDKGKKQSVGKFEVDQETIRINEFVPLSKFQLEAKKGERVYDTDLGYFLDADGIGADVSSSLYDNFDLDSDVDVGLESGAGSKSSQQKSDTIEDPASIGSQGVDQGDRGNVHPVFQAILISIGFLIVAGVVLYFVVRQKKASLNSPPLKP